MLAAALLCTLAALSAQDDGRQREYYEDGALKAEYKVDPDGTKDGWYREYWPDGEGKVKAVYDRGVLDGRYRSWHADGTPHIETKYVEGAPDGDWQEWWPDGTPKVVSEFDAGKRVGWYREWQADGTLALEEQYAADLLDGARRVLAGGAVLTDQEWSAGALVGLWGSRRLYPVALDTLRETLSDIAAQAEEARPTRPRLRGEPEDAAWIQAQALERLRAVRAVAGLPWQDVVFDELAGTRAQAAVELIAKVGAIESAPENPGLPEERYREGLAALEHCLVAQGWTWPRALDGFLHPPALAGLAARRLVLQPRYRLAGFGQQGDFTTFWMLDSSGPPWNGEAVCWPAVGWMPVELFGQDAGWSVDLSPKHWRAPDIDALKVRVWALEDDYMRGPLPLDLDLLRTDRFQVEFRPQGIRPAAGYRYWVDIEGLKDAAGKPARFAYLVHFTTREAPLLPEDD